MKERQFPRLYGLVGILCALYFIIFDELSFPLQQNPRRKLIIQDDTCTSKICSNLFFLSGIHDVVNLDLRFLAPVEKHESQTIFEKAYFSEKGRSKVKAFSSFEFFLSSYLNNVKSSISGTYQSETIVNGSAIIVVSEYPGREVWFHSDALLTSPCLNETTSLIVFANAMNSEVSLYTKTPEGLCQKIEMEDETISPLTYCQSRSGYVWKIYADWKCSTENIASDYIDGGLGTVYSVIIGNNISTADLVTISSHSTFPQAPSFGENNNEQPPAFFRQKSMIMLVILVGSGSLCVLFVFGIGIRLQKSSGLGIREGSLVVYELTQHQIDKMRSTKQLRNPKSKGYAIIIRAPPIGFLSRLTTGWIGRLNLFPKDVLLLQPLKRVVRPEDKSFKELMNSKSDVEDSSLTSVELTVDELEAPIGINRWGFRGGRVLFVFSSRDIERRYIDIESLPKNNRSSVRFADSAKEEDLKALMWIESDETASLLATKTECSLRNRKGRKTEIPAEVNEFEGKKENFWARIWKNRFFHDDDSSFGSGWMDPHHEDEIFCLEDSSSSNILVHSHLKKSSVRYEFETSSNSENGLPEGMQFSYLLKDLPPRIAGENIQRIHCREWVYPISKDGKYISRKHSSRRTMSRTTSKPVELPPLVNESISPSSRKSFRDGLLEPKKILKASSKTEELLNVLVKEHNNSPLNLTNEAAPNVSEFKASPQPVTVRIAMRREISRKNRVQLPSISPDSSVSVFTAPRLITSPLPGVKSDSLKVEEISSPNSPMQSYFVTPPRADSGTNRKATRQLSAELYSQTNKKVPKKPMLISPNSSPHLNQGNSVNSSSTTIPTSHIVVNADREVTTGTGTVDKVITGSKLEIDDEENEEEYSQQISKSKRYQKTSQQRNVSNASPPISLKSVPYQNSPRELSPSSSNLRRPAQSQTFASSPKTLPIRASPRKTLSARKIEDNQNPIQVTECEELNSDMKHKPPISARASSKFDMDLSFIADLTDV